MTAQITSDVIADAAVIEAKIGTGVVTENKLGTGAVTASKIGSGAVTHEKVAAGAVVQFVSAETRAMATGSTTIPADDTIPQNTEGFEVLTCAITPKSATNKLLIEATVCASHVTDTARIVAALFQDSTADALHCVSFSQSAAGGVSNNRFSFVMTSGTTSATTFKLRIGSGSAGTITVNGIGGARYYGGAMANTISITEFKA